MDRNPVVEIFETLDACRPLTGAWIETSERRFIGIDDPVAPSQGRGSKHSHPRGSWLCQPVAPSQGRGSKLASARRGWHGGVSPPHRGVDRNDSLVAVATQRLGRPLTGAWIETAQPTTLPATARVAPSQGRGSKPYTEARIGQTI